MKITAIGYKNAVGFLAALFAVLFSGLQVCTAVCRDENVVDCTTLAIGCTRGGWGVFCSRVGTNDCKVDWELCWEITSASGSCGDCCVYLQGSHRNCVYYDPLVLAVTGTYGTPNCDPSNCLGQCINRTPYPPGTTYQYAEITDSYCGE